MYARHSTTTAVALRFDFGFVVGGFDGGLGAATRPRLSGSGGGEASGEMAEEGCIRTGAGQRDANARGTFHHARGDLDKMQPERRELGAE